MRENNHFWIKKWNKVIMRQRGWMEFYLLAIWDVYFYWPRVLVGGQ